LRRADDGQLRSDTGGLDLQLQRRSGGKLLGQLCRDHCIADLECGHAIRHAADHQRFKHLARLE
jgi:hypothetical protein